MNETFVTFSWINGRATIAIAKGDEITEDAGVVEMGTPIITFDDESATLTLTLAHATRHTQNDDERALLDGARDWLLWQYRGAM